MMNSQTSIAYVIDLRFPGGTSAAVASELTVAAQLGRVSVHAVSSKMFTGFNVAPKLRKILRELHLEMLPAVDVPRDRRGRHSRPGLEKFPGIAEMDLCFPKCAKANVILGADLFLNANLNRPHWKMFAFQGPDVVRYFEAIDFTVYFTTPTWRESFGRVPAESVAAGKVTISDVETASIFDGAVIASTPSQVGRVIAEFVQDPARYHRQVELGQSRLQEFPSAAFQKFFLSLLSRQVGGAA